jgi:hypothetical protein
MWLTPFSWASMVCFALALSMLQILMVRSKQAEAKTLVSLGFYGGRLVGMSSRSSRSVTHDRESHHIVLVPHKLTDTSPVLLPVEHADGHVVGGRQDDAEHGMHHNCSDVIGMPVVGLSATSSDVRAPRGSTYASNDLTFSLVFQLTTRSWKSSLPHTIQFFLSMNRPARTGTSVSSKVLMMDWVS